MIHYDEILKLSPYALRRKEKAGFLLPLLRELTARHYHECLPYRKMLFALSVNPGALEDVARIPFLPVRLFKEFELRTVSEREIVKTMTSSGTSGQQVSKIYLDKDTAAHQTKALARIVNAFLGKSRCPMIIIDGESTVSNRASFSARGAGILGFSMFGKDKVFALDKQMRPDVPKLQAFLEKYRGEDIFVFGFTFMIWQYFVEVLARQGAQLDLSRAVLIHGGGWKKLQEQAVPPEVFKRRLHEVFGIARVHDYYGMVEQTGSIHVECEHGQLHTSIFGDVIIRRAEDFSEAPVGERGIIQVLSVLPWSYPGHSLLTEDEGVLLGEDDCPCGRHGKYFRVLGRIKNAEIRGCSDTHEAKYR